MSVFRRRRVHLTTPKEWTPDAGTLLLYEVLDAPGALALAARAPTEPCGLWIEPEVGYPLVLLARDLLTSARIAPLVEVVYGRDEANRLVLEELLNGRAAPEESSLAGLVLPGGAPQPVRVWTSEGADLRRPGAVVPLDDDLSSHS